MQLFGRTSLWTVFHWGVNLPSDKCHRNDLTLQVYARSGYTSHPPVPWMKSCVIRKQVINHLSVTADYKWLSIISTHFPNDEDIYPSCLDDKQRGKSSHKTKRDFTPWILRKSMEPLGTKKMQKTLLKKDDCPEQSKNSQTPIIWK